MFGLVNSVQIYLSQPSQAQAHFFWLDLMSIKSFIPHLSPTDKNQYLSSFVSEGSIQYCFWVNLFQVVSLLIRVVHLDNSWSSVVVWQLQWYGSKVHLSPLVVLMVPSDILCFIRFYGVASRWVCLSHLGCSVCPIWVALSVPSGLLCLSHLGCCVQ